MKMFNSLAITLTNNQFGQFFFLVPRLDFHWGSFWPGRGVEKHSFVVYGHLTSETVEEINLN